MELIGLAGYARVGKDEAAKVLVEEFGFTRVAFADKLREVLYALNPIVKYEGPYDKYHRGDWRMQDVINEFTWDGYKETGFSYEIRQLLQRLGTEAGRQTLWDSIWVDAAFAGVSEDAKVVVTDCRFPNEAQAIKDRGGQVWRVAREGIGPANSHASETSLDTWAFDWRIHNSGDLEEYHENIRRIYEEFSSKGWREGGYVDESN